MSVVPYQFEANTSKAWEAQCAIIVLSIFIMYINSDYCKMMCSLTIFELVVTDRLKLEIKNNREVNLTQR